MQQYIFLSFLFFCVRFFWFVLYFKPRVVELLWDRGEYISLKQRVIQKQGETLFQYYTLCRGVGVGVGVGQSCLAFLPLPFPIGVLHKGYNLKRLFYFWTSLHFKEFCSPFSMDYAVIVLQLHIFSYWNQDHPHTFLIIHSLQ